MDNIIHIQTAQIGSENVNSVNSRDIYEYLEVNTKYADWIKRAIEKYDFAENEDFTILKNGNGSNAFLDYIVTLDMAKELCMVSNTVKGKETRKYFIKAEKQSQRVLSVSEQIQLIAQGNQIIDERLTVLEKTKRLENWQERALHDAKNQTVYRIANGDDVLAKRLHLKVWNLFKKQFHLPRYNELPAIRFEDGKSYILNLTLADMI